MTSYDPMDLQKLLATAYDAGCRYAVLEVSSHAMDQERFAGIDFDIAALTNITADHLDRHKTVDEYAKSKQKLFHALAQNRKGVAILPKDDSYGKKRFETMSFGKKIDYAVDTTASLSATDCVLDRDGSHAKIDYIGTEAYLDTKLVGKYNISNILAATGILLSLDQPLDDIMSAMHDYIQEPGRQEKYEHLDCDWYVDFAHTVNGLRVTLEYLSSIKKNGRLICVF
jgi:UDP-N-acetylmuramoyl-L-alanyl-D-glutamate--2,6-diaminopimelate ligase